LGKVAATFLPFCLPVDVKGKNKSEYVSPYQSYHACYLDNKVIIINNGKVMWPELQRFDPAMSTCGAHSVGGVSSSRSK